ncbi:MAG: corrinoid protein [Chloroflexi bacterium]|nr:corrinoid protein [Chloroflexota bacterium]MCL5074425.1 corrinoid protein [Chloroflexota bacterium]
MDKQDILDRLTKAMVEGDEAEARRASEEAIVAGIDPLEAVKEGGAKGMQIIGERFQNGEAFLPELILAAEAMKASLAVLVPKISAERKGEVSLGRVVIGTVSGDLHDIGKNLVGAILSAHGFEVYDLGVDVPSRKFIEKAEEVKADFIGLSSLMSTSAYYQKDVIKYLVDMGLRQKYYVVVGGGPVTAEWATEIGADGYARSAAEAPPVFKRLVEGTVQPPLPRPIVA